MTLPQPHSNSRPTQSNPTTLKDHEFSLPREGVLHRLVKELYRMEHGEERDINGFIVLLTHMPITDLTHLAWVVDAFIERQSHRLNEKTTYPRLVYGLYNCTFFLEQSGMKEMAELLYEKLLPLAENSHDKQITAWVHVASGINSTAMEDETGAFHHFSRAFALIKDCDLRFNPNALNIYEYFAKRALLDEGLKYRDPEIIADLKRWCRYILAVIDHPSNKAGREALSLQVLSGLECVAESQLILENLGESPQPGALKSFERLSIHARLSADPIRFSRALFRLAAVHAARAEYEDSMAYCVSVLFALENQVSNSANELRERTSRVIHQLSQILGNNQDDFDQPDERQ